MHDNVLLGVTVWSVSQVLKIVLPKLYITCWTPWLWALISLWVVSQVAIFGTKAVKKAHRGSNEQPLSELELLDKKGEVIPLRAKY